MSDGFSISNYLKESKEDPKKALPPVAVILIIGFVVYKFLYSPKALLLDKEMKKNKKLTADMRNFKNAASQLEDIQMDINDKEEKWNKTKELCYKELEKTVFLRRVRELALKSNMNVKSINPLPDENITIGVVNAKKFTVEFNYLGNLDNLITFMRFIELEPKICFMPIPNLKPTASGTFDTVINVSAILFPDIISTEVSEEEQSEEEEEE